MFTPNIFQIILTFSKIKRPIINVILKFNLWLTHEALKLEVLLWRHTRPSSFVRRLHVRDNGDAA
ncbi:MAG TPA: hypothetical protein DIC56_22990 [Rhizobium sp.]|nr:hypothetical protein [Rhizobium sp.]